MTSSSTLGFSSITLQFDLSRNVDGAASDTLAAINAAGGPTAAEHDLSADDPEGQPG